MQCFTALHIQGHLKNTYHLNIDVLGQDNSAQAITSRPRTSVRYVIRNKIWPPDEMVVTAAHSIEKMSYKDFKTVANSENLVTIRRSRFTGGRRRRVFLSTKRIRTCVSRSAIRGGRRPQRSPIAVFTVLQLHNLRIRFSENFSLKLYIKTMDST